MIRLVMTGILSLSMLVVATAQQEQQNSQQPDQTERAKKIGEQDDKKGEGQNSPQQPQRTELPELFNQLDLNEQQKQQLLTIYRESDQESQEIWERIQKLHRQAISMEAAAIAAARLEGHDHNAHAKAGDDPAKTGSDRQVNPTAANQITGEASDAKSPPGRTAEAPVANADTEKRKAGKNNDGNNANARRANRRDKRQAEDSGQTDDNNSTPSLGGEGDLNVVAVRVGIAQPDGRIREYTLTSPNHRGDQESDPSFDAHSNQLTKVWKDIHDGHEQLVELEADTIVKVEAQLTEAQLQKLDATTSQAATSPTNPSNDSRK